MIIVFIYILQNFTILCTFRDRNNAQAHTNAREPHILHVI